MPNISQIAFSTDFDSLKNDANASGQIVIPGSSVIAAGVTETYDAVFNVGSPRSMAVVVYRSAVDEALATARHDLSAGRRFDRTGTVSGVDAPYAIILRFSHESGNTIRVTATITNGYSSSLTLDSTDEVFTLDLRTIKEPRFS